MLTRSAISSFYSLSTSFVVKPCALHTAAESSYLLPQLLVTLLSETISYDSCLKACLQSLLQDLLAGQQSFFGAQFDLLAGQPNANQTRNKQPPETSFEGNWRMGTSLWKMCLDTGPLPDLPEPGLRKNTHTGLGQHGVRAIS